MPEVIENVSVRNANHGKYDWDVWTDGTPRKFVRGKDFECAVGSFRQNAYVAGKKRGLKLRSAILDNETVELQFRDAAGKTTTATVSSKSSDSSDD